MSDNWAATDAIGRKLPGHAEVGDVKKDKYVAVFYWTWHGRRHANPGYANVSRIIRQYPDAVNDYDHPAWNAVSGVHACHWAEPLFGYYRTTDPWVLRKHAEMLSDAGVDVVVFDCTNGTFTWKESYDVLIKTWTRARQDGVKTPQITFLCPFGPSDNSRVIVEHLYNDVYKTGHFKDLWFYWNGKPLIMAYPDNIKEPARSFFTFRPGQPDYRSGSRRKDDWSWLEVYPQNGYVEYRPGQYEMVSVGAAQNATDSLAPAAMNDTNQVYGRSYTKANGFDRRPEAVLYGLNFQEQWNRAFELDPKLIFVTGWNEWIAGRFKNWQGTENAFPDEFNVEYSRDIEPAKAMIGDNYYYQLVGNIRKFKGVKSVTSSIGPKSIKIDGDFNDWIGVKPDYYDHKGDTLHRNHRGYGDLVYTNTTGRNDFVKSRISYDEDNVYFYIETAETITASDKPGWMMLLVDADRDKTTGWQGYDYIVNRSRTAGNRAVIEKNLNNVWRWEKAGDLKFQFKGNRMELCVRRILLMNHTSGRIDFEFKWADNIMQNGDIMDFYVSGDVAPSARFNYVYSVE
ncbi:MAG: hypothetical protein J7M40_01140 [Planctomycetes bacterium]|nr:hypothetical protein [Planctomycetota bacterium]